MIRLKWSLRAVPKKGRHVGHTEESYASPQNVIIAYKDTKPDEVETLINYAGRLNLLYGIETAFTVELRKRMLKLLF